MKTFYILVVLLLISGCIDNKNESLSKTTTPAATITETVVATDVATPAAIATDVATPAASVNETESVKDTETVVATDVATPAAIATDVATPAASVNETESVRDIVQYDIGQSTDNGNTKIVLNGIRFAESIGDTKIMPEPGSKFLIVNVSIENIGNESSLYYKDQFVILDEGGDMEMIYAVDILGSSNLFHRFDGENIKPGEERKGELAYQVPKNAKGLKLKFEYSDSTSEIFSLN
jgi:Domain of unknown function (DUF4352)